MAVVVSESWFRPHSEEIPMIRSMAAADTAELLSPVASSSEGFHARFNLPARPHLVPA
jgi:hypothetical protein